MRTDRMVCRCPEGFALSAVWPRSGRMQFSWGCTMSSNWICSIGLVFYRLPWHARAMLRYLIKTFYVVPVFRGRCESSGRNLSIWPMPMVKGRAGFTPATQLKFEARLSSAAINSALPRHHLLATGASLAIGSRFPGGWRLSFRTAYKSPMTTRFEEHVAGIPPKSWIRQQRGNRHDPRQMGYCRPEY